MTRAATREIKAPAAPRSRSKAAELPYFVASQLPLTSLIFLLPPIIIYEVGMRFISTEIIAFKLVRDFFFLFGATGRHLPALAVVFILLWMHIARSDPWRVQANVLGGMLLESLVLAVPVLLMSVVAWRYLAQLPLMAGGGPSWEAMLILSLGAGIYEELVFRLILCTLLHGIVVDILKMELRIAIPIVVAVPALLFSGYHYLGNESFSVHSLVFRTLAGVYFGALFLFRGFGVTAGAHAAYDIIVVTLSPQSFA